MRFRARLEDSTEAEVLRQIRRLRHANLFQTVPYLNSEEGFNHLLYSEKRRAHKDELRLKVSIIARLPPKFR
jgi:hypothetical protein